MKNVAKDWSNFDDIGFFQAGSREKPTISNKKIRHHSWNCVKHVIEFNEIDDRMSSCAYSVLIFPTNYNLCVTCHYQEHARIVLKHDPHSCHSTVIYQAFLV